MVLQVGSEDGRVQRGLGVVEEGQLLRRADGVERAEGQAQEAVDGRVRGEAGGDGGGHLDSLGRDGQAADGDLVLVDGAAGGGAVAVGDGPGGARQLAGGAAAGGVVAGLAVDLWGTNTCQHVIVVSTGLVDKAERLLGCLTSLEGVRVLKTHRSEEPVSKSRFRVCAGVPIDTGVT